MSTPESAASLRRVLETPLGPIWALTTAEGVAGLAFGPGACHATGVSVEPAGADAVAHMAQLEQELHEYFTGGRGTFSVAIALRGTPFQLRVWHELRQIPRGVTISYAELAERIGSPAAVRAVGQANRVNPVAIVIPCHRVIAADGSLHGYAGGHAVKRRLLELEGALSSDHPLLAAG